MLLRIVLRTNGDMVAAILPADCRRAKVADDGVVELRLRVREEMVCARNDTNIFWLRQLFIPLPELGQGAILVELTLDDQLGLRARREAARLQQRDRHTNAQ